MRGFKVTHQVFVLVSLPLIFELLFLAVLVSLNQRVFVEVDAINRSREIVSCSELIQKHLYKMLTDGVSYLTSQNMDYRKHVSESRIQCLETMKTLEFIMAHDYDRETIDNLHQRVYLIIGAFDGLLARVKTGELSILFLGQDRRISAAQDDIDNLVQEFEQILEHEQEVTQSRTKSERIARQSLMQVVYFGMFTNIILVIFLTWGFGKLFITKLERIIENAQRFADRRELLPALIEDTELGYLDRSFRDMTIAVNRAAKRERDIIENAADVICSLDSKGRFTSVSPAAEQVWLYAPSALLGTRYNMITDDNGDLLSRSEQEFSLETAMRRSDEKVIYTTWSVKRSLSDSNYFCVVRDVTETKLAQDNLRASEEEIRTLLSSMFTAVIKVNDQGYIVSANNRTEQLFDVSAESILGKPLSSILEFPAELSSEDAFAQFKERSLDKVMEMSGRQSDGGSVAVDVCLSEYQAFESKFFVVNILDCSERRKLQELKKQFVAMISHDLRTPIVSVSSVLELAVAGALGDLPDKCSKRLSRAQENLQRLMELINDLLELEKLDSGTMQISLKSVCVSDLFERATLAIDDLSQRAGIKLEVTPIKISFMADQKRLGQVLINLISNSIKFSPRGTTIGLSAIEKLNTVEIKVMDQGAGISSEELPYLFDRFSRVSKDSETRIKGTGLGLSICKSIVELHGGKISVTSEVGVGTIFHLEFPKLPGIHQ